MHLDRQIVSRCIGLIYFGNVLITYSSKHVSNVASIRKAPEVSLGQYLGVCLGRVPVYVVSVFQERALGMYSGVCSGTAFGDSG